MLRVSYILTTTALLAVCAAPASAIPYEDLRSSYEPAPQGGQDGDASTAAVDGGYRTSYQPVPPSNTGHGQDLRSPDAADAAAHRGLYEAKKEPYALNRDYGSPDAVDAGRNLPPVQVPTIVADGTPSAGFDWGDAGIGAAGMFGLFAIAAGSALLLTIRRRGQRLA
jgi:hypothetical protein